MSNGSELPRAVIDTNLIVSGFIAEGGLPRQLLIAARRESFRMILSDLLREEYGSVLSRPRLASRFQLAPNEFTAFVDFILTRSEVVTPAAEVPVSVRDVKDDMVLATALGGRAQYLVTGDEDLLALRGHPALPDRRIVTVRGFLELLANP